MQRALLAAGGERTGGNVKSAPQLGPMGWQMPDAWDVLWSPSTTALKAADALQPGQLLCVVPGACVRQLGGGSCAPGSRVAAPWLGNS